MVEVCDYGILPLAAIPSSLIVDFNLKPVKLKKLMIYYTGIVVAITSIGQKPAR